MERTPTRLQRRPSHASQAPCSAWSPVVAPRLARHIGQQDLEAGLGRSGDATVQRGESVGAGEFGDERLPIGLSGSERLCEHSTAVVTSQRVVKDSRCWDASVTTDVVAGQDASIEKPVHVWTRHAEMVGYFGRRHRAIGKSANDFASALKEIDKQFEFGSELCGVCIGDEILNLL